MEAPVQLLVGAALCFALRGAASFPGKNLGRQLQSTAVWAHFAAPILLQMDQCAAPSSVNGVARAHRHEYICFGGYIMILGAEKVSEK